MLRTRLVAQLARFGVVGTVGLVIDVALFNALRLTVLAPEVLHEGPVIAKVISTSVAIVANWLGNRYWTFHREQRAHPVGEGLRFAAVSVVAMVIPLTCLWVSHYALGFTSLLADNVSTNVVGLALGMVFRFWLYRTWVFADASDSGSTERPVVPSGGAPLHRIQAVATVDDRARTHD
jgi:putative flippase GtrA